MPLWGASPSLDVTTGPVAGLDARRLLRAGLPCLLIVDTGSMAPLLPVGATVEVRPCRARDLRVAEVACIDADAGPLLLHRYQGHFRRDGSCWIVTRGDRCAGPDAPTAAARVMGRVSAVHWHGLRLSLDRHLGRCVDRALQAGVRIRRLWARRQP